MVLIDTSLEVAKVSLSLEKNTLISKASQTLCVESLGAVSQN